MPKYELRAGAAIELLDKEELRSGLDEAVGKLVRTRREEAGETILHSSMFTLNASGATSGPSFPDGIARVYRVPVGFNAWVVRLTLDFEGSNAASTVSCDVRICADANTPSATRSLISVLPNVFSESRSHAPLFRGGQYVGVGITGFTPASTTIYSTVQVILIPRNVAHVPDVIARSSADS